MACYDSRFVSAGCLRKCSGCHRDSIKVGKSMMTGMYIVLVRIFYRLFGMCFAEAFIPFVRFIFSEVTKNVSLFSLRPSHEVQISAGSAETGLNKSSEQCRHSICKHFETNASVLICSFFFKDYLYLSRLSRRSELSTICLHF